jgi:hypothetical protein
MLTKKTSRAAGIGIGAIAVAALVATAAPAHAATEVAEPEEFTSAFTVMATPGEVIDADGNVAPGEEGAEGTFTFRINSDLEIICYDITLTGVTGDYESPADTATHIHEAAAGEPGPPRIAFPNPGPITDGERTSSGCLEGPFTTGIENDGVDTGEGFTLAQIEANPAGFTGDSHTVDFAAGVVRGQLTQVPVGGAETGVGPAASGFDGAGLAVAGAGVLALAGVGILVSRRRHAAA